MSRVPQKCFLKDLTHSLNGGKGTVSAALIVGFLLTSIAPSDVCTSFGLDWHLKWASVSFYCTSDDMHFFCTFSTLLLYLFDNGLGAQIGWKCTWSISKGRVTYEHTQADKKGVMWRWSAHFTSTIFIPKGLVSSRQGPNSLSYGMTSTTDFLSAAFTDYIIKLVSYQNRDWRGQ